jgi:hypothetical protein
MGRGHQLGIHGERSRPFRPTRVESSRTEWRRYQDAPALGWQMTRSTHEALISDAEAETILTKLETSQVGKSLPQAMAANSNYLLTGLLYTEDGQMWVSQGKYYRLKKRDGLPGKTVLAGSIECAVLEQVEAGTKSDLFLRKLLAAAQRHRRTTAPAAAIDPQIPKLEKEKNRAAELALTSDSGVAPSDRTGRGLVTAHKFTG